MHCGGVWDIVTDRRIIDVVSDLLGDTVVLRHSHLFAKLPGDPRRVSWHQDASYWPLTPSRVVSAWLAFDDVDVANSAMQVIPTPDNASSADPVRDASLSRWRQRRVPARCALQRRCTYSLQVLESPPTRVEIDIASNRVYSNVTH